MTDDLVSALREVSAALEAVGLEYMIVGSVAALAHGHTRSTQDFDLVVEMDRSTLARFLDCLDTQRFYVSPEAAAEAIERESLFNLIDMESGWKVDIVPRKQRAFSKTEFSRRQQMNLLGLDVWVATLEDTLLAKLEWCQIAGGSKRQLEDATALLRLAGSAADREYLEEWARKLGVEELLAEINEP